MMKELELKNARPTDSAPKKLPIIGYGTYKVENAVAQQQVETALEVGYRHIDTAQMYRNEQGVGAGLATALRGGISRDDLFVTTKLDDTNHDPQVARDTFARSLEDLGLDYVDLFLIHWPLPKTQPSYVKVWEQMLEFQQSGLAKQVGVSNFEIAHLQAIEAATGVLPVLNQIEIHPSFLNPEVAAWCQDRGIIVEAWSPLGRAQDLALPVLVEVAQEVQATPAQVALAAAMERGQSVIPKASSRQRMAENFAATQVQLSAEQLARLATADQGEAGRIGSHPNDRN